jgi:glyoxylate utilization-related uncharacterized protein
MRKIPIALALAAAFNLAHAASVTPEEHQLIELFMPIYHQLTAAGAHVGVLIVDDAKEGSTPVEMLIMRDGTCNLAIQVRGNGLYQRVRALSTDPDAFMQAAEAHEAEHCLQALHGDATTDANRAAHEMEADAYALAWTQANNPGAYTAVHDAFKALRTTFADANHPRIAALMD